MTISQSIQHTYYSSRISHIFTHNLTLYISRNPDHHSRPTFEDLARELYRDSEALLSWSQQDKETSSKASVLGAPLEKGKHLYQDLQNKYK